MVFIVDTSASVGEQNFAKVMTWITELTASFLIGEGKTRFGVVTYNDETKYALRLDREFSSRRRFHAAVNSIKYEAGNTYMTTFRKPPTARMKFLSNVFDGFWVFILVRLCRLLRMRHSDPKWVQ